MIPALKNEIGRAESSVTKVRGERQTVVACPDETRHTRCCPDESLARLNSSSSQTSGNGCVSAGGVTPALRYSATTDAALNKEASRSVLLKFSTRATALERRLVQVNHGLIGLGAAALTLTP